MARRQSKVPGVDVSAAGETREQLGVPGVAGLAGAGVNSILATQRRNIETLSAFNRTIVDSVQAIAEQQNEMLRDCVGDLTGAVRDVMQAGGRESRARQQAAFTRRAMQNATRHMRKSAEIASQSGDRVLEAVGHHITSSFDDLRRAIATLDRRGGART